MKRVLGAIALAVALVSPVNAAKPVASTWALAQEIITESPSGPTHCRDEDDFHQRTWTGSLDSVFTATEPFCDWATDGYDAGGTGLFLAFSEYGTARTVRIISPSGLVTNAEVMATSRFRGKTRYDWAACAVPTYSQDPVRGYGHIEGGTWTVEVDGTFSDASLRVTVAMAEPVQQIAKCPVSQQHLIP